MAMIKNPKYFFVCCLVIILVMGGFFYYQYLEKERHQFKVIFLNIGQGDAALIQFENGEKMLVDCGPNRGVLSALGRNMAFYDRTIDYVMISHPDLDHYGGCVDVLKNYQVKEVITNGQEKPSDKFWQEWNKTEQNSGAVQKIIKGHEKIVISSSTIEVLSPDSNLKIGKTSDSNDYSIVFRLTHGREHFLFTGDMEAPLEKALVDKYCDIDHPLTPSFVRRGQTNDDLSSRGAIDLPLRRGGAEGSCPLQADILKVGHHGSDGASSELFLSFVKPKTAIISVGMNKFGHPTLRAMRHLKRAGAMIMRTDLSGDIVLR